MRAVVRDVPVVEGLADVNGLVEVEAELPLVLVDVEIV